MRKIGDNIDGAPHASPAAITTLVMSQHEGVRRQLVTYLGRLPSLAVSGDLFSTEAIARTHPDVLVLDLSQLERGGLRQAIDAARRVGARLVALASMCDPIDERAVTAAGGLYRLKSAGPDGLAEIVLGVAARPVSSPLPSAEASVPGADAGQTAPI